MSKHPEWQRHCHNLEFETTIHGLDNFLDFQAIRETMFVGNAEYTWFELAELQEYGVDMAELEDCDKHTKNHQHPQLKNSTGNTIHHRYHLHYFEKMTGVKITDMDSIFELGGGYGNMARIISKMGFNKEYIISDLPEFVDLQKYYLGYHNVPANWSPNYWGECDLFLATWSLSEIPLEGRGVYEDLDANYHLIAFGPDYAGIDNMAYFKEWVRQHPRQEWIMEETPYMKNQFYLTGITK